MYRLNKILRLILYIILAGALAGLFFYARSMATLTSHGYSLNYYQAPETTISNIHLKVMYFVPRDRSVDPAWKQDITRALQDVRVFHHKEFSGYGILRYTVYPEPIQGKESIVFYDSADTSRGNRNALETILQETQRRIFMADGDLYVPTFSERKPHEFRIKIFIYEGVGAAGGHLGVILAREYLTKTAYGPTILYHELLHTFGVPDSYDYETNQSFSDDIMGSGRELPLQTTYIRNIIKAALGYSPAQNQNDGR